MSKFFRFLGLVAGVAAAGYLLRDKLVRIPEEPGPPPHFKGASPNGEATDSQAATSAVLADDLTEINGIGPAYAQRLTEAGISTFAELAAADPTTTAEAIEVSPDQLETWVEQARQRLG